MILFLAAVYSLIINQCYQKKTIAKAFPPSYNNSAIAKNADEDTLSVRPTVRTALYIIPATEPDYFSRYAVMR